VGVFGASFPSGGVAGQFVYHLSSLECLQQGFSVYAFASALKWLWRSPKWSKC
jgi:hypothetical protein